MSDLPREIQQQYRIALERDIASWRAKDRGNYQVDRNAYEYVHFLRGIYKFLSYVRGISSNNGASLLWLGEGTLQAVEQFLRAGWLNGINQIATTLDTEICRTVSEVEVLACGGERLSDQRRSIDDQTILGIISVFALQFSARPDLVVKELQRVLSPSGVIKMVVSSKQLNGIGGSERWIPIFTDNELSVALHEGLEFDVILAVKPPVLVTACELLEQDNQTMGNQLEGFCPYGWTS